ncbi:MAG: PHP domain-containing protein [Acidimicrobiaceae bacterium]|nr:PHP domain-containing protein [Acidimicrobiaceae bacterium]MYK75226.1 PHP domain-containing protein [Acidimicrobiaceae bacterium]
MRPSMALSLAIHYLDREFAPAPKVRAFQRALAVAEDLGDAALADRSAAGTLTDLDGVGPSTARVIAEALAGIDDGYLADLAQRSRVPVGAGGPVLERLRGDCHCHTDWSDGGAPLRAMAETAAALGHEWVAITDHSARLTVAHGLDEGRLRRQMEEIARLNAEMAPFRILTGMEVDILEDGSLDLSDDLLAELDVVVASVHSKLRMPSAEMTPRMVAAIANPNTDILGHCTNRKVVGGGRPPSAFDAEIVFAACAQFDKAVEINCRPERQDPPEELLTLAVQWGCKVSVDTDAHATGQLEWQPYGADKAVRCDVPVDDIVNTWPVDALLEWTGNRSRN